MIGKGISFKKEMPLYEVLDILEQRKEKAELGYEQKLTYEYCKKFSKLPKTKAAKLIEELKAVEGMDEHLAIKIVDILPEKIEVLKLLVPKGSKLKDEKLQEIMKIAGKYQKK